MNTKKHQDHPHLSGEHKYGDLGQVILLLLFLAVWITDSFLFHYSTFLIDMVPDYIRITLAGLVLIAAWILVRTGIRTVFGTERSEPELITTGVFSIVRHPIYTGALLFCVGSSLITMSLASAGCCVSLGFFYYMISRYEERILKEEFGNDYLNYSRKVGMMFPKLPVRSGR